MIPALLLLLLTLAGPQSSPLPPRTPANVVSPGAAEWLERSSREEEERPELVLAAMKLEDGDVIADVGAGSGFYSRRIARAVGPKGLVYANDIQQEMLDALQQNAAKEKITNIIPILGSETDPKLPKATFDWVLLVDVYHEFQQPKPMLDAIRASLKPEGRVALVEYRETHEGVSPPHRMSKEQVLAEWLPAGFCLERIDESLPIQRLYVFTAR